MLGKCWEHEGAGRWSVVQVAHEWWGGGGEEELSLGAETFFWL